MFRISGISLAHFGNRDAGLGRASSVELCSCPMGYKGSSCEDCATGYTRSSEGLYLGLCKPCQCFGHSSICHTDTGVCIVSPCSFLGNALYKVRHSKVNKVIWLKLIEKMDILTFLDYIYVAKGLEF